MTCALAGCWQGCLLLCACHALAVVRRGWHRWGIEGVRAVLRGCVLRQCRWNVQFDDVRVVEELEDLDLALDLAYHVKMPHPLFAENLDGNKVPCMHQHQHTCCNTRESGMAKEKTTRRRGQHLLRKAAQSPQPDMRTRCRWAGGQVGRCDTVTLVGRGNTRRQGRAHEPLPLVLFIYFKCGIADSLHCTTVLSLHGVCVWETGVVYRKGEAWNRFLGVSMHV